MSVIDERVSVAIKNILFATDLTLASVRASGYAKAMARRFSSTVEIAHVFDPSVVTSYEEAIIGLPLSHRRKVCSENLKLWNTDFVDAQIKTSTSLIEGHQPYKDLLKLAREHHVELIVAGTDAKSGLDRFILGSTAEHLIRGAECPVLTVGPQAVPAGNSPLIFRSIVFATDFSVESARAAAFALSFAQDSGAHLHFCYVLGVPNMTLSQRDYLDINFRAALERMVPESAYDWCSPEFVVEHGVAANAILELTERVSADLIVVGPRKESFWLNHIERGVTPDLLAQASCPVMTIR